MSKKLRFGLVGCGIISELHAKAIAEAEQAELVAVFDPVAASMDKFVERWPAIKCSSLEELLSRDDIDIVSVLTPSALHTDVGIEVAKHKKHVIVEKPIDIDYKRAKKLCEVCEENGVQLAVTLQHHYDDAAIAGKAAIEAGELGTVNIGASHNIWWRAPLYFDSAPWRGKWDKNGGGTLIMQAIHYIDLMLYMMGDVDTVTGYWATRSHNIEVEDVAAAAIKFKSGALGLIEATTAAYPGLPASLTVGGDKGTFIIENDEIKTWILESGKSWEEFLPPLAPGEERIPASYFDIQTPVWSMSSLAHRKQYVSICDDILNGRPVGLTGRDALKVLKLILAVYESGRTGQPIKMDEWDG